MTNKKGSADYSIYGQNCREDLAKVYSVEGGQNQDISESCAH